MKRLWTVDELDEQWSVDVRDHDLLHRKESTGRLGLVAQLAFYRRYARFPEHRGELAAAVVEHLAKQIDALPATLDEYEWSDRTGRRHRELVLQHLGVRSFDLVAEAEFCTWLLRDALPKEPNVEVLDEMGHGLAAAQHGRAAGRLHLQPDRTRGEARARGGRLLRRARAPRSGDVPSPQGAARRGRERTAAARSAASRPRPRGPRERTRRGREALLPAVAGLAIRHSPSPSALRAERRLDEELLEDVRRVRGKEGILYRIAEAASEQPDGIVREVIYPIASEETLANIVKEYRASDGGYRRKVHTVLRASYGSHDRRMLPKLLDTLTFRSNNAVHRPLLQAIEVIKARRDEQEQHYSVSEIPVEGVIRPMWRDIVIEGLPMAKSA